MNMFVMCSMLSRKVVRFRCCSLRNGYGVCLVIVVISIVQLRQISGISSMLFSVCQCSVLCGSSYYYLSRYSVGIVQCRLVLIYYCSLVGCYSFCNVSMQMYVVILMYNLIIVVIVVFSIFVWISLMYFRYIVRLLRIVK